jgi:hypothetical protein
MIPIIIIIIIIICYQFNEQNIIAKLKVTDDFYISVTKLNHR